ncbi:hypothetical protein M446_5875 [Methylobacterium sp. 4-46]|nr:hypothetical protein M446_5875 [Methylobacterium sp. 4-46]
MRPSAIEVLSGGYLAAAVWCADLRAAEERRVSETPQDGAAPQSPRAASLHQLAPRARPRTPRPQPAAILPFGRAAARR